MRVQSVHALGGGGFPSTQMKKGDAMEEFLSVRLILYRLLASLFLYPDDERLATLKPVAKELLENPIWEGYPFSAHVQELLEHLAKLNLEAPKPIIDAYNRLFLVRPQAPPHETFYTDAQGQFRGLLTSQLEEEYLQAGLAVSPDLNELPDHIAVELEFMAFLCSQEIEALEAENGTKAQEYRNNQRSFMAAHLARWFPKFAKRIVKAEPESIYRYLLPAAYNFLLHELKFLELQP